MQINCSINGKRVTPACGKISIFDNSLFYGDGLFETFLAVGNRTIYLEDHLERMERGAKLIGLEIPVSKNVLAEWIDTAVRKNPANIKKIRLTLTAGNSSFWAGYATKPRIIIIVTDYSLPKNPFRLMVSPFRIDEKSPFRTIKTLSFIIEMTSRKKAYATGFDDALLLNRAGNVAETSSANIFWANQGNLYTPPLSAGCLNGMTRKHILRIAKENNVTAYERNIKLKSLLTAQEIFITSSLKLILPVVNIQAEKSFRYKAGKLTNRLQQLLLDDIMGVK